MSAFKERDVAGIRPIGQSLWGPRTWIQIPTQLLCVLKPHF